MTSHSFFSALWLFGLFARKTVESPQAIPNTAPASTSVGQCTNRKTREKAMRQARTRAGIPHFLEWQKNTVAAAKEAQVCPEGKEKPEGGEISREM